MAERGRGDPHLARLARGDDDIIVGNKVACQHGLQLWRKYTRGVVAGGAPLRHTAGRHAARSTAARARCRQGQCYATYGDEGYKEDTGISGGYEDIRRIRYIRRTRGYSEDRGVYGGHVGDEDDKSGIGGGHGGYEWETGGDEGDTETRNIVNWLGRAPLPYTHPIPPHNHTHILSPSLRCTEAEAAHKPLPGMPHAKQSSSSSTTTARQAEPLLSACRTSKSPLSTALPARIAFCRAADRPAEVSGQRRQGPAGIRHHQAGIARASRGG